MKDDNYLYTKIIKAVGHRKKVIDFGCSSGFLAKALKKEFNCKVWGVEMDPNDAKIAKKYCEDVFIGDLDEDGWATSLKKDQNYDVAIFADVLEHLKNPVRVLKEVKKLLTPDGYLVISIPNVAHSAIRLELLSGEWEYEKLGIMDETHLRFFTRRSTGNLLEKAGFFINYFDSISIDFSDKFIRTYLDRIKLEFTEGLKKLLQEDEAKVVQYVIKASVKKPENYNGWERSKFIKPLNLNTERFSILDKNSKNLVSQLQEAERSLEVKQDEVNKISGELSDVYKSKGWKLVLFIRKMKKMILNR